MKNTFKAWWKTGAMAAIATMALVGCNKDLPKAVPNTPPTPTGSSIADVVNSTATYSFLKAAIARAGSGLAFNPSDRTAVYTFFAPDNNAFIASGIPSETVINAMPAAQVAAILNYHVIPGIVLQSTNMSNIFPNQYLQTSLVLAAPSASLPTGLRMSLFPSIRGGNIYGNNIPIKAVDNLVANGVMHIPAGLIMPPSTTVKGLIASDTSLTLFAAAIARADSGQTGLNKLDSVMNYPAANITVFSPKNSALRAMFPPGTPDATIIALLNNPAYFTAQTVRGLVAYHMLGSRAFTVNLPATASQISTLLTLPTVPAGLPIIAQWNGTTATVKGIANATASTVVAGNVHGINGVLNAIDQVLRPQ